MKSKKSRHLTTSKKRTKKKFDKKNSRERGVARVCIHTYINMLRSLSLKKDKSRNPTYILVNQVRATMIFIISLSLSLFVCAWVCFQKMSLSLSLIREKLEKAPIVFCETALWMYTHIITFLFLFLLLLSRLRTACTFKSQTGPVTSSSRTESTTITIERPSQKMRRKRCELNSCRGSLESSF